MLALITSVNQTVDVGTSDQVRMQLYLPYSDQAAAIGYLYLFIYHCSVEKAEYVLFLEYSPPVN